MTADFEMIQGDSKIIIVICENPDGSTIDLSTASDIKFGVIRLGGINGDAIITKSLGSGIVVQNINEAVITIDDVDTASLSGKYQYTVTVKDFGTPANSSSLSEIFIVNPSAIL